MSDLWLPLKVTCDPYEVVCSEQQLSVGPFPPNRRLSPWWCTMCSWVCFWFNLAERDATLRFFLSMSFKLNVNSNDHAAKPIFVLWGKCNLLAFILLVWRHCLSRQWHVWAGTCTDILGGRCSNSKKGHPMPKKNSDSWSISSNTLMMLSSTCVSSGQHQTASLHFLYE